MSTLESGRRSVPQASLTLSSYILLVLIIIIILPYLFLFPNDLVADRKTLIEFADVRLLNKYDIKTIAQCHGWA